MLHEPGLWMATMLLGAFGLLGDCAWRSWHFEGRVADWGWFVGTPAPARTQFPIGPPRPLAPAPVVAWHRFIDDSPAPEPEPEPSLERQLEHLGATEQWSPIAAVAAAGESVEAWLSERLQQFDNRLREIEQHPESDAGAELQRFTEGSQRMHAYRMLSLPTLEWTRQQRAELDARLSAAV